MFIETDDISFLSTLKEHKAKQVVIHYCCQNCDDEQVTYEEEVTEEMISDFEEKRTHYRDSLYLLWCKYFIP